MDIDKALELIDEAISGIDQFDDTYAKVKDADGSVFKRLWAESLKIEASAVRPRLELVRQVAEHVGADDLPITREPDKGVYKSHPFAANRDALVVLRTRLAEQQRMAAILGPTGPKLSSSNLHSTIWEAAAHLFDGGHYRQAVQAAGQALESHLQALAGPSLSGQSLAKLFGSGSDGPRLYFAGLDLDGKTYRSAREGAANLIRGSMLGVRNLVSHPEWPDPGENEALEMLAVLSYVAHLVDRAEPLEETYPLN